eukprot:CAMPEP_0183733886 /NCGR_PEP_ID=MMETSP0737-20130205/42307_1 /TAXON_ID=385413 /ORGANISM="Thalassiosira miniscula, Strain CCMP1093" /LENGTH=867 /DNA_ID=CAMNT_0025967247 /DNA_START=14 /DNA_END=2617 /DNA_ORIENTATION=+
MNNDGTGKKCAELHRGGEAPDNNAIILPGERLQKQLSDPPFLVPRQASSSPVPLSSSSSTTSTFSSVTAHLSKHSKSGSASAAASGSVCVSSSDNSSVGKAGAVACARNTKTKKSDRKWMCPKCQGDVRLPPPSASLEAKTATSTSSSIDLNEEDEEIREALSLTTAMCGFKCCPAPRYHLTCSGVAKGSQIFHNTIISSQTAVKISVNKKYDTKQILEHLYSPLEGVWWSLPTEVKKSKQRSQRSLQNDENWPTSTLSFMCPSCDVEGTSRYLSEYFERFHMMKASFYKEYLRGSKMNGTYNRLDAAEECVETRTGEAFLWHLMKNNLQEYESKRHIRGENEKKFEWNPSEIKLKSLARVLTFLSKQLQHQQMRQLKRRQKRQKNKFQLDPSYLVGMPIRLFNPIDNSYHSGRIMDHKVNAPYKVDQPISNLKVAPSESDSFPNIGQLTDEKICSTLFLIRFRHGVEGRKVTVHQWIYLEEHAITVGGEICWAKVGDHFGSTKAGDMIEKDNNNTHKVQNSGSGTHAVLKSNAKLQAQKYFSQYRPVQILFRSMLEMIPLHNLNPPIKMPGVGGEMSQTDSSCLNVLASGFGQAFSHVRLALGKNGINPMKAKQLAMHETQKSIFDETAETTTPVAIPLTSSNPLWIDQSLHRAQLSDEDVALGLAMACMEKEEERRARTFHHLAVSHFSQPSLMKRKRELLTSSIPPPTVPITKPKERQTECSPAVSKSASLPRKVDFYNIVSLEDAASLGCPKCMKEFSSGVKSNSRSHAEKCPRRRNFSRVSLEVAASSGCAKCVKELKTGSKTNKAHDDNCPRRNPREYASIDEVKASIAIQLKNAAAAGSMCPPCLKQDTRSQRKKQKVSL